MSEKVMLQCEHFVPLDSECSRCTGKIPMDAKPPNEPRAVRILRTAIKKLEFVSHQLDHDMSQWPHEEDYADQLALIHALVKMLERKMTNEKHK